MRKCVMILLIGLVGCNTSPDTGPASPEAPAAGASTPCIGTLAEYCQRTPAGCPTYEQSVARQRAHCTEPGPRSTMAHECARVYRSVAWRFPLLGGGEEYFDGAGQLVGAYLETDYFAYCSGTSTSQTFGTIPSCLTERTNQDLCVRQDGA